MTTSVRLVSVIAAAAALLAALATPADAQPAPAPFPIGKPVTIYVGTDTGGTNDMLMRLVAKHIGKHLPGNPNVVPRNMPGAGGRTLVGHLYNRAPRDGTEIGAVQRAISTDPLIADPNMPFKMAEMTWIGSPSGTTDVCLVWHTSPIQKFEDIYAREMVLAASGTSERNVFILKELVPQAKIKSIIGFPGGNEMNLAMERGEADGRCSLAWESIRSNYADWVPQNKIRVLLQYRFTPHQDLPNVPLIVDLATSERDKKALEILLTPGDIGYPFLAPPGLLPEVRDTLRRAYDETMADPDFKADADKARFALYPKKGADIQALVERVYASSPDVIERAKQLGTAK